MKISILKSIFCLSVFFFSISTVSAQKGTQKVEIKTVLNCDHCKVCETCGLKFQTEMLKIKGVKMYELDDKAMIFTVFFNPKKTNIETIREEISKLGYDADTIKATPEGIASLDGCCKI